MKQVIAIDGPIQASIARPRVPVGIGAMPAPEILRDDDSFSDSLFRHCTFSGQARRVSITRVKLQNVQFKAMLPAVECEDVILEGCDLSNVDFSDAILLRVAFINCRMTGVNFSGAGWRDTVMENSMASYANFRFTHFTRALFAGCNCANTDFEEVSFDRVRFVRTDLRQAQMSGTPLAGIDFTGCDIDGLGARPENLRGAIFSAGQAVTAAKIAGVVIR